MIIHADLTFLGSGASLGVPVIGCDCPVCRSGDIHNKRTRPSVILKVGNKQILIDCGPDFRQQALRENITTLDAIIATHTHYDHIGGYDDLRPFFGHKVGRRKESLPCLLSHETAEDIVKRFDYMFKPREPGQVLLPLIQFNYLDGDRGVIIYEGLKLRYLSYSQAGMKVNGFVCGNLAYTSDIKDYPETIFEDLKGVEVLIISALRFTPSNVHLTVDEAVDFANRVGAKSTWLTHLSHELDHEKTNAYLPSNVRMAYDGLQIKFYAEVETDA